MSMSTLKNHCAAGDCREIVPVGMLMCRAHWFQVPKHIRDRVWSAVRARQRNEQGARAAHLGAVKEAIKSLKKGENQ